MPIDIIRLEDRVAVNLISTEQAKGNRGMHQVAVMYKGGTSTFILGEDFLPKKATVSEMGRLSREVSVKDFFDGHAIQIYEALHKLYGIELTRDPKPLVEAIKRKNNPESRTTPDLHLTLYNLTQHYSEKKILEAMMARHERYKKNVA